MKRGRSFNDRDNGSAPPVVVINEAMAKQFWIKGDDPLKSRLVIGRGVMREFAEEPERQIVGIVGDVRDETVLCQAVKGRDAVLSALGTPASPFREVTLLSSATRALVDAMKAEQVARLISITGMGAGDSAGHGGFVQLVEVKDNKVYLQMGGGCQGCGAADVTLKAGIERLIKEELPEIEEVLDSTDHASGTNPYYTPDK